MVFESVDAAGHTLWRRGLFAGSIFNSLKPGTPERAAVKGFGVEFYRVDRYAHGEKKCEKTVHIIDIFLPKC